ncbi:MAG: galactose mutarotase [Paracoccus denitrificans]|nr:MAG: galactose mutarotase [Paracoccus denitrificans]PZO86320.1 MAG: galactose mutarotase [Paracoccus denitrificans]
MRDPVTDVPLPDGRPCQRLTLRGGGLTAQILTLGAIVQDLRLDGIAHSLVLGCADVADYFNGGRYLGAVVGRFANRIGGAQFTLDGVTHHTDPNFRGRHTLHGGSVGMDLQVWDIIERRDDAVTLGLRLPDDDMGFPGNLSAQVQIALSDGALVLDMTATADAPTPCNLAHHGYFNLDGSDDVRDHTLWIDADRYLAVDDDLIPLPGTSDVADTRFDFREPRRILPGGYDHNFCLSDGPRPPRVVALLQGKSGLRMEVATNAPGLQVYDGAHFDGLAGLDGRRYGPFAGIAMETQGWPDAPNRNDFPSAILRPGQTYHHHVSYGFSA